MLILQTYSEEGKPEKIAVPEQLYLDGLTTITTYIVESENPAKQEKKQKERAKEAAVVGV